MSEALSEADGQNGECSLCAKGPQSYVPSLGTGDVGSFSARATSAVCSAVVQNSVRSRTFHFW